MLFGDVAFYVCTMWLERNFLIEWTIKMDREELDFEIGKILKHCVLCESLF